MSAKRTNPTDLTDEDDEIIQRKKKRSNASNWLDEFSNNNFNLSRETLINIRRLYILKLRSEQYDIDKGCYHYYGRDILDKIAKELFNITNLR